MYFQHSSDIWNDFPELVPGALFVEGITGQADVSAQVERYTAIATARLAETTEGEMPEIQAWRRAFSRMGLKPTQYRCASESLLRRLRKERALPQIHPLIDLCNAISVAFAVPVAAFDVSRLAEYVEVRYAVGDERYLTFSNEVERPYPHEVIFADAAQRAHARRWSNRQSGYSAIRETTSAALIVAEAMHDTTRADIPRLLETLSAELHTAWATNPTSALLSQSKPRFTF